MQQIILIFIGGGLGSLCRYGLARWITNHASGFPLATFVANVLSCLILGIVLALSLKNSVSDTTRLMMITGFCGGFSTFSTFSNETLQLLQSGAYTTAFANVFISLLICITSIYLGMKLVG